MNQKILFRTKFRSRRMGDRVGAAAKLLPCGLNAQTVPYLCGEREDVDEDEII